MTITGDAIADHMGGIIKSCTRFCQRVAFAMAIGFIRSYLHAHWTGAQSLKWSFWVNLVALRIVIVALQAFFLPTDPVDAAYRIPVVLLGVFCHGVVFVWQVVGVLRAGETHIRGLGSMSDMWGAQLGILVIVWVVIADSWGVWLAIQPAPPKDDFAARMEREHASKYDLSLAPDGVSALFVGDIELGSTKAVSAFLVAHPGVNTLVLTSTGGNIYEARGLARLAREKRLNTQALTICSSACTIAFIGGVRRALGQDTRLGFHQYRVSADYDVPFADPKAEQARDVELFRQAGVADWFLNNMYSTTSDGMWYPTTQQLEQAGVLVQN
jgi:hypothetical protein